MTPTIRDAVIETANGIAEGTVDATRLLPLCCVTDTENGAIGCRGCPADTGQTTAAGVFCAISYDDRNEALCELARILTWPEVGP